MAPRPADDLLTVARAGCLWGGPDAVLTGEIAAALTFLPDRPVNEVVIAVPHRISVRRQRWFKTCRQLPPEFVVRRGGLALTSPAMTAVDLAADEDGGNAIDAALRTRSATLDLMWQAFAAQPNRIGNQRRRQLLHDSRDRPWSECERELHRLLRRNRIRGWRTNAWTPAGIGGYYPDVVFRAARLIVEADGWEFHSSREAFEADRRRRNELVLAGYVVLNFTWRQITEEPDWVIGCIRQALRRARRENPQRVAG